MMYFELVLLVQKELNFILLEKFINFSSSEYLEYFKEKLWIIENDNMVSYRMNYKVNDVIDSSQYPLRRIFARFYFVVDSISDAIKLVNEIRSTVEIRDNNNQDMIIRTKAFVKYLEYAEKYENATQ